MILQVLYEAARLGLPPRMSWQVGGPRKSYEVRWRVRGLELSPGACKKQVCKAKDAERELARNS